MRRPAAPGGEAGPAPGDGPLTSMLPVERAWRLAERADEHRWLVAGLWSDEAVGIVGGEPKCCKSFLALDLAVSIASGAPCLRRFDVLKAGRVLLYAAEDALHVVRRRLDDIAAAAGARLADLDIQVIVAPTLRLDLEVDRRNLAETVDRLRPRLLVLDPFVRLHRIDENASGEVAPLLAWLRELQRATASPCSSCTTPGRAACLRAGQALRGSSEFHAWGDSNLYLRRDGEELTLTAEHRAAPSSRPLVVELVQNGPALALEAVERARPVAVATPALDERVTAALAEAREPLPFADLRARCRVRAATLHERVGLLAAAGRIVKTADGYRLAHRSALRSRFPFPASLQRMGKGTGTPGREAALPSSPTESRGSPASNGIMLRGSPGWVGQFPCSAGGRFLVPTCAAELASRAGAVKDARQARPTGLVLDGPEHGARLGAVGTRKAPSASSSASRCGPRLPTWRNCREHRPAHQTT